MPSIEDSGNLSGIMEAQVVKNDDPTGEGRIGVFIPKLMFENDYDEDPWEDKNKVEIKLDVGKLYKNILNFQKDFDGSGTLGDLKFKKINFIWVRPTSFFNAFTSGKGNEYNTGSYRVPRVGAPVFIFFLDEDPQKGYYLPISPTKNGDELTFPETPKNKNPFVDIFDKKKKDVKKWTDDTWYKDDKKKRYNIDIIRSYFSGMRIEANNENHSISIVNNIGDRIIVSPRGIEIFGNFTVYGNFKVYDENCIPEKILKEKNKELVLDKPEDYNYHPSFEVLNPTTTGEQIPITRINGIGYIYDEEEDVDNIIPAMHEEEEAVDAQDDDEASTQNIQDLKDL